MYVYYFIIVQNKAVIAFIIIINLKYTMSKNVSLQMSVLFASGLNNLIHFNFQVPLQTLPCQLNLWIQQ